MYREGGKKKGHIWGPALQSEQLFWPILKYSATVYDFIDQQNSALTNKIKKLLNLKTTGVVQFKWRDWDPQWIQSHRPGGNRPGVTSIVLIWLWDWKQRPGWILLVPGPWGHLCSWMHRAWRLFSSLGLFSHLWKEQSGSCPERLHSYTSLIRP